MSKLYVGAASRDITPKPEMLPLEKASPFGNINKILDTGATRAIALKSGEKTVLLISADIIGLPRCEETRAEISAMTGIAEKDIFMFGTHAHATPMADRKPKPGMPNTAAVGTTALYVDMLLGKMKEAALEAIENLKPAKMGIGYGKSYVNTNRNQDFTSNNMLGVNPEGPSDKTATVIRFDGEDGAPIAFFLNYAVHAVIMHCNRYDVNDPNAMGYSTDLPGRTSELFEKKYPGAVAIWTAAASGDQNPIFMTAGYCPNPENGEFMGVTIEGGGYGLLTLAANRHFDDMRRVAEKIVCDSEELEIATDMRPAVLPGRTVIREPGFENRMKRPTGYINEGEFEVPMALCRIGDVSLCCISGELYTTLGWKLKETVPNTVVISYYMDTVGYIPDDEAIEKVSFGAAAPYQPGYAADLMPENYRTMQREAN